MLRVVCYTAIFSVVTQRSSPLSGEERCVKNGCVANYVAGCKFHLQPALRRLARE